MLIPIHALIQIRRFSRVRLVVATPHGRRKPELPQEAGCCWTGFLVLGPLLRCLAMASLAAWGVWRSDFPVPENACIALLVGNVLGILQLIIFLDEAKVPQVSRLSCFVLRSFNTSMVAVGSECLRCFQ